jgi:ubiquitin thioesterase OTU1
MPDDNSCLFRAFGTAVLPGDDLTMTELRSLVASSIQAQPDVYSEVVLEQKPDEYCRWIQTEDAWGGGIEMGILSQHFDIEICSIDVQVCTCSLNDDSRHPVNICIVSACG